MVLRFLFLPPEAPIEKRQMDQQPNGSAGNEAIGHIEDWKRDKICGNHVHHIASENPVQNVAQTAAQNGCQAPQLEPGKRQEFFVQAPNQQGCKRYENCNK